MKVNFDATPRAEDVWCCGRVLTRDDSATYDSFRAAFARPLCSGPTYGGSHPSSTRWNGAGGRHYAAKGRLQYARRGAYEITAAASPRVLMSTGRPIISPPTGDRHRVRIDLPAGIEFEIAEIGSASAKASEPVELDLNDTYRPVQTPLPYRHGCGSHAAVSRRLDLSAKLARRMQSQKREETMTETKWTIKGREFIHCNCAYGCPCQFNARPTEGSCHAIGFVDIEEGHHGETKLDGLKIGMIVSWPGAIHEGGGQVVPIVDERASAEQREALLRIMSGLDTEPGATFFQVFSTTFEKVHDPVFAKIGFDIDVDGRVAQVNVPGWVEARGEPIRNPVTGDEHRARINLPHGFEYDVCEVGRGWAETRGAVKLSLQDSHAHFARLHMTESGVAH